MKSLYQQDLCLNRKILVFWLIEFVNYLFDLPRFFDQAHKRKIIEPMTLMQFHSQQQNPSWNIAYVIKKRKIKWKFWSNIYIVLAKDRHSDCVGKYDRCNESPVIKALWQLTHITETDQKMYIFSFRWCEGQNIIMNCFLYLSTSRDCFTRFLNFKRISNSETTLLFHCSHNRFISNLNNAGWWIDSIFDQRHPNFNTDISKYTM